jgi:transcriptional regulator with XRE-family HTH domain
MSLTFSSPVPALKSRRLRLGMSQLQVAKVTGKTQSQIARIEKGVVDPRISTLMQISRSLGVELIAVPTRLVAAVEYLLSEYEQGKVSTSPRSTRLVGNHPENPKQEEAANE